MTLAVTIAAALLGGICLLQRRLMRVREHYIAEIVAVTASSLRAVADGFARIVPLYEDMISRDPSIAETLQIDLIELHELRSNTLKAVDYIEAYAALVNLGSSRPSLREALKARRRLTELGPELPDRPPRPTEPPS